MITCTRACARACAIATCRYITDPASDSAPVICVEQCPTEATMLAAGITPNSDNTARCNPTDPFCQRHCIKDAFDETAAAAEGYTGNQYETPYGLFNKDANNFYMTTDHDRGNCYQNGDIQACRNDVYDTVTDNGETATLTENESKTAVEEALNNAMSFFVDWGETALDSALVALGIETGVDDWNVNVEGVAPLIAPNWGECKDAARLDPGSTNANPNCANTGCPRDIIATYDLPATVRVLYKPCIPTLFGSTGEWISDTFDSYVEQLKDTPLYQEIMASVSKTLPIIGWCMLIAVVLSYILIILMKWVVRPLIITLCIIAMLLIIAVCGVLWYFKYTYDEQLLLLDDPVRRHTPLSIRRKKKKKWYPTPA